MLRSRNWYPKFQEMRDEMDLRPLQYKKAKAQRMFLMDDWRDRRFDQKNAAMVAQKREPNIYASRFLYAYR